MKHISWNARKRWILTFYAVFIIVIIFSIVLSYFYSSKESMETEMDNTQQALLSQISQNIELRLSYIDKYLVTVCERDEIGAYFSGAEQDAVAAAQLRRDIDALANSDGAIESVYLYSKASNTVFADGMIYSEADFFDRGWAADAAELVSRREVWTMPRRVYRPGLVNQNTSVFSMLRTYPLITTPENIKGYVVVNINTELLNQIVAESLQSANAVFMILDMENNVLSRSNSFFTYAEEEIISELSETNEQTFSTEAGGKPFFVKYITFSAADWKILSISPYGTLLEKVRTFRNTNIFIALAVSVFMLITIILTNKWMNAPVDKFLGLIVRNVEKNENHKISNFEEIGNMFLYMATQQKDLQRQLDVNIPFIKYQLVTKILSESSVSYEEIRAQLSLTKIQLYPSNYIVMLSDLDNKDIIDVNAPEYGFDVYISSLYNKAEELVNQENCGFATQLPDKMCLTVLSFEKDDAQQNMIKAFEIAEHLSNFMRDYYGLSITTAIGDYYPEFSGISKSYAEVTRLIKYKSIVGTGSIITTDDAPLEDESNHQKHNAAKDKLMRAFESGSRENTKTLLDELFAVLKKEKRPSDVIIRLAMQLVRECMEFYRGEGFEISNEHYRNIDISLNQLETADEIKTFIWHILDEMLVDLKERKLVRGTDELVSKIVDYVNTEYAEYNMSLNLLADKFALSVPYLSKIFKNCTSKTFTEYLIEIRIKRAAELLVSSNKKVNEIANEVGYPNPSSFIRIFKKYYYMTPVDYRNRHKFKK